MRLFKQVLSTVAVLSVWACSPAESPPDAGGAISATNHTFFPITVGTPHELGRVALDGAIGCDSCHPPASTTFADFTCITCHEHAQNITDPLHLSVTGSNLSPKYVYTSPGCLSCHKDGAQVPFDHSGIVGGPVACATCHDVGAVFAALPFVEPDGGAFTHPSMSGSDCGACHNIIDWASATGAPADAFDPAQNVDVDAGVPTYSGTSIATVSWQTEILSMHMDHVSTQFAAAASSACGNCHSTSAPMTGDVGVFHASVGTLGLPQPTACSDCHTAANAPVGFVGSLATNPLRSPPTGEMKHDAVSWSGGTPTTTPLVTDDCATCHTPPSDVLATTWATDAGYHASLSAHAKTQPRECLDCHANTRPTSQVSVPGLAVTFDHQQAIALGECSTCHTKAAPAQFQDWTGGHFHIATNPTPATCETCHGAERPVTTAGWDSGTYANIPFDYGTNAKNVTHGDGQDCALCHASTQTWVGGTFSHAPSTPAGETCVTCHTTQRPTMVVYDPTDAGFDHSVNGTGDCAGCHQATVMANHYLLLTDWAGGQRYPGSTLTSSTDQFIVVNMTTLNRSGTNNLITGMTTVSATLNNGMLHTSAAVPSQIFPGPTNMPNNGVCFACHTHDSMDNVTTLANGLFHAALADGGFAPVTDHCADCHLPMIRDSLGAGVTGIVEKGGSELQPMDHSAQFTTAVSTDGGTRALNLDCHVCHNNPGVSWNDGQFHVKIAAMSVAPKACDVCHYPLMADATKADVDGGTGNNSYKMQHRSGQITTQKCQTCHGSALGKATTGTASTLFAVGSYHASVTQQSAIVYCHAATEPTGTTQSTWSYTISAGGSASNQGQWLSHTASVVAGKDCAVCHAADAKMSGASWIPTPRDLLHITGVTATTCQGCHGLSNGNGSTAGMGNNMPPGLSSSMTLTTAAAAGVDAGTLDTLTHVDPNVTGRECNACHTQVGISTVAGVMGKEWAQAKFHANTPTVAGRCSNCHMNERPPSTFTGQDHSAFTADAGTQDCSSCHGYPGVAGAVPTPNWLGAAGTPATIPIGGFTIANPPVAGVTETPNTIPHPAVASGETCATCHVTNTPMTGAKNTIGYDHALAPATGCAECHEAGSNLLGTPWTLNASGAVQLRATCGKGSGNVADRAGDTRPIGITGISCAEQAATLTCGSANCSLNHFYPADCSECHKKPASGLSTTQTGQPYVTGWQFPHTEGNMNKTSDPTTSTCCKCHKPQGTTGANCSG